MTGIRRWRVLLIAVGVLAGASSAWATHNPHLGRFMQRDPLGYPDGMNGYEYERSMPSSAVDPDARRVVARGNKRFADRLLKAAESLCPCFKYRLKGQGNRWELKIRTWKKKNSKGEFVKLPYDHTDETETETLCKCYLPSEKTWKQLKRILAAFSSKDINWKKKNAKAVSKRIGALNGNRGHMGGCALVASMVARKATWYIDVAPKKRGSSRVFKKARRIEWYSDDDRDATTPSISLAHEFAHVVMGLGGGGDERKVSTYENAVRWEGGKRLRLNYPYGKGTNILQTQQQRLMRWPKLDRCDCPNTKTSKEKDKDVGNE